MRRTGRASKGLLRGEDAASDELLLVCSGKEGGRGAAAGAAALTAVAALAATGAAAAATAAWEGEEQEISSLQESTALIPDVSNSMVTLMDERMTLELEKFSGFFLIHTHNAMLSTGEEATHLYSRLLGSQRLSQ